MTPVARTARRSLTTSRTRPRTRPVRPINRDAGRHLLAGEGSGIDAIPLDRVEQLLPTDLIHDDEVVILLLRPSPAFVILSSLGSLALIALVTFVLAYMAKASWVTWSDTSAFLLGAAMTLLRLGWQVLEWLSRVYVLTDRRIIRRMGVLRVAVFETRLQNIQHTGVFTSVRERLLGLGSIGFATSGSDTFEAFWVMLSNPYGVHRIVVETMKRYGQNAR